MYDNIGELEQLISIDISGKTIAEQKDVNIHTELTIEAISNPEYKKADLDKLNQAINSVPENLSIYTDDSVKALTELIEKAKEYENSNITKQKEINTFAQQIYGAVDKLAQKETPTKPDSSTETESTAQSGTEEATTVKSESTTQKSSAAGSNTNRNTSRTSPNTGNMIALNLSLKVWLNITPLSLPKKLFVDKLKTQRNVSLTVDLLHLVITLMMTTTFRLMKKLRCILLKFTRLMTVE